MEHKEQLDLWVKGESVHNDEKGECCPDFSCCNNKVNTPQVIKELFRDEYLKGDKGNEGLMNRLLMEFLGNAFSGENVYIAGLETSRQEVEPLNKEGE